MVVVDEAFKGAGKKPGIEIWRIKEFRVIPLDKTEYGSFYSGDSYIVLSTKANSEWDVHFWLGTQTTQDEYGTAAIKTVELDDLLGGGPVQYREVQDHESALFLSYFKNGIKYLCGGYESGFRHVDRYKVEPKLFQCKGKRNVRVKEVPLSRDSLNRGDVFIMDAGLDIYVWMPPESGRLERTKGIQVGANIRDQERGGRATVHVLDTNWNDHEGFWSRLGGRGTIKTAEAGGGDEEHWRKEKPMIALYRVSDASGSMKVQKVAEGDLSLDMLDSKDAFILDAASGGIFVWIGKVCTQDERNKAMSYATTFLKQQGKAAYVQVVRVLESSEPAIFTQWFARTPSNKAAFTPHLFQCSDETGTLSVEEICNFTQEDLDGDDVMILDIGELIFVWVGEKATEYEQGAARRVAKTYLLTDAIPRPNGAKVTTIQQGNEAPEFTRAFKSWDAKLWKQSRTVEDTRQRLSATNL